MVAYRIRDWEKFFENNRTRDLKTMTWVPVPNKHDGDGYTELLDHPNGPAHFAAWVVMVQIASKCDPRGSLLRDGARPHDSGSLSRISRIPRSVFDEAIPRLLEVGWIETIEADTEGVTDISHVGAGTPQEGASSRVRASGTERNGTEGNGNTPDSGLRRPGSVSGEAEQDEGRWFQTIPELAEARQRIVTPAQPGCLAHSAFRAIRPAHLGNPAQMALWHRRALGCEEPIVGNTEAHVLLTMAAGLYADSVPDAEIRKSRVAFFANLVTRRLWWKVAYKLPEAARALEQLKQEHGGEIP